MRRRLRRAARRAWEAGIVVVAAAGNLGRNALGESQYGGITAPGNAPWVLTVGASTHQGTHLRYDDAVAGFSSRGPAWLDFQAKPDLVAPGVGIVSLASPGSLLYTTKTTALLNGAFPTLTKPYLSLSGTSMAAPVVAGTVALMVQANPSLTPNLVKAILQYTAQSYPVHNPLTQGAGFLNAKGAVDLARFFAVAQAGQRGGGDRELGNLLAAGLQQPGVVQQGAEQQGLTQGQWLGALGKRVAAHRRRHRICRPLHDPAPLPNACR